MKTYPVKDATIKTIFDKKVWPELTEQQPQSSASPEIYVLGGQPGAGKSQLEKLVKDVHGTNFVSINGDEFRKFHPQFNEIQKEQGRDAASFTAEFSGKITGMALERASAEKLNVSVEGTFRTTATPLKTLNDFQQAGYKTQVLIATCPSAVSWGSTLSRYSNMEQTGQQPRYTPKTAHDAVVGMLGENTNTVLDNGKPERLRVFNRDGLLYDSALDQGKQPGEIIDHELNRPLTPKEHGDVLADYSRMEATQKRLQASRSEQAITQNQKMAYLLRSQDKEAIVQYPGLAKVQQNLERMARTTRRTLPELIETKAQQIEKGLIRDLHQDKGLER